MQIIKTEIAREDIISIGVYFDMQSTELADSFLLALEETLQTIKTFTHIGHKYNDIDNHELRVLQIKKFKRLLIFYKVSEKEVLIVRIIHSSRDIPNLIEDLV